jgi:phosphopantothenoylcysteine decarboxylase / phosphopantothenate---cysteine ligase
MNLQHKKVLLCITGSIAAYKSILLLRLLVKSGAEVQVVLSASAANFVSPLVLETLSKKPVLQDIATGSSWANHVQLGRWADVMVVAPATCNTLAKMAHGQCDNLLLAIYLSATCKVLVAPAMDEDMWHHPATQANLETLRNFGVQLANVSYGELGSGLVGMGRMQEPEQLLLDIEELLLKKASLAGKKVLITAGATHEKLDPVRFLGNNSSGKMGIALAEWFYLHGAEVHLVLGPTHLLPKYAGIQLLNVGTAAEMFAAVEQDFSTSAITVCAAAVADFTPIKTYDQKIKKEEGKQEWELVLTKTTDILAYCGKQKSKHQLVVGFALETDNALANAHKKLLSKKADAIVLNSPSPTTGFNSDTNEVFLLTGDAEALHFPLGNKQDIACKLVEKFIELYDNKK